MRNAHAGSGADAMRNLHTYAPTAAIVKVAKSVALDDAARKLVTLPRLPSGDAPDDIAVVLVRIRKCMARSARALG